MKLSNWKLAMAGLGLALSTLLLPGCGSSGDSLEEFVNQQIVNQPPVGPAPVVTFDVVNTYPHATDAFTQGLLFDNGFLYESTGLEGQSSLRQVNLNNGQVIRQVDNDPTVFAEGLALRAGRLYQLTLDDGFANIFSQTTFALENTLPTRVPAWGLTYIAAGDRFVFSDGSSTLRYLNSNLQEVGAIQVTDNGQPVTQLNELEYVNGVIMANRFLTDEIVGIDPLTGVVLFRANLAGIIDKQAEGLGFNDVLNGIAYDATLDRLFVTGKRWPLLYEVVLVQQ